VAFDTAALAKTEFDALVKRDETRCATGTTSSDGTKYTASFTSFTQGPWIGVTDTGTGTTTKGATGFIAWYGVLRDNEILVVAVASFGKGQYAAGVAQQAQHYLDLMIQRVQTIAPAQ
jgi:hypothetical protein